MADEVTYYAVVSGDGTFKRSIGPGTTPRSGEGRVDEALNRDLTWGRASAIMEWNRDAWSSD